MKRVAALLLALVIAAGCAFGAAAAPAQPQEKKFRTFNESLLPAEGPVTQGLAYTLPEVAAISAVWNGKILLYWSNLEPYFSPENMDITVAFTDEPSEQLSKWSDRGDGWWWEIYWEYDEATGILELYYLDTNLYDAYADTLENPWEDYDWEAFSKTLPHTTVLTLVNIQDKALAALPELKLNESTPVAITEPPFLLAFKPAASGYYSFTSSESGSDGDPVLCLYDADVNQIASDDDSGGEREFKLTAWLEAGETYYLALSDYSGNKMSCKVIAKLESEDALWGGEFKLCGSEFAVRYSTYCYVTAEKLVLYNGYTGVLANGVPLEEYKFFAEGSKVGTLTTVKFTSADGKTTLGTVDVVCKMSTLQWVCYYLLGGWLWMRLLPIVNAENIPSQSTMTGRVYENLMGLWRSLWYGKN